MNHKSELFTKAIIYLHSLSITETQTNESHVKGCCFWIESIVRHRQPGSLRGRELFQVAKMLKLNHESKMCRKFKTTYAKMLSLTQAQKNVDHSECWLLGGRRIVWLIKLLKRPALCNPPPLVCSNRNIKNVETVLALPWWPRYMVGTWINELRMSFRRLVWKLWPLLYDWHHSV